MKISKNETEFRKTSYKCSFSVCYNANTTKHKTKLYNLMPKFHWMKLFQTIYFCPELITSRQFKERHYFIFKMHVFCVQGTQTWCEWALQSMCNSNEQWTAHSLDPYGLFLFPLSLDSYPLLPPTHFLSLHHILSWCKLLSEYRHQCCSSGIQRKGTDPPQTFHNLSVLTLE